MKEVNFIARKNPNDLDNSLSNFSRRRAKAILTSEDLSKIPFMHFESPTDRKFFQKISSQILTNNSKLSHCDFVYTHTKRYAIKEHRDALKNGLNVCTLVDMDHDVGGEMIGNTKKIHTTKYACTLYTMQFIKNEKELDKKHLKKIIKKICSEKNDAKINSIIDNALTITEQSLVGGDKKAREILKQYELEEPLNDHALCEAIVENEWKGTDRQEAMKKTGLQKMFERYLQKQALNDRNGLIKHLLKRMLNDLFPNAT